jgi:hypothetical protein
MRVKGMMTTIAVLLVATCASAWASGVDNPGAGGALNRGGKPIVYVTAPGEDPSGSAGGSGSVTCQLFDVAGGVDPGSIGSGNPVANPQEGAPHWLLCSDGYVNLITYQPGLTAIDAATLARRAYNELPLLYPRPRTAPPRASNQLVGVRTWLWVEPADWQPLSATASIVGLSATVTAQPTKVVWTMGDGDEVTCDGPGTPYDPTRPDTQQSTDCSHTYQHHGTYTALATIVWTVAWTATNGARGNLGTVQRSTQFPLTVEQRQAVITG